MDIYYINLARRTDRRDFMEAQFQKLGLAATRIEAVTPADISEELRRGPVPVSVVTIAALFEWVLSAEASSVRSGKKPARCSRTSARACA